MIYESLSLSLIRAVAGLHGLRVLDVGCGSGALGELLQSRGNHVEGITHCEAEAEVASRRLARVHLLDLDELREADAALPAEQPFDAIVFSEVLEHLHDPLAVLKSFLRLLSPSGRVYVSLPNVACFYVRFGLLFGRFEKSPYGGILDETHLHFFTRRGAERLLRNAELIVERIDYVPAMSVWAYQFLKKPGGPPPSDLKNGRLFRFYEKRLYPAEHLVTRCLPGLLANQYVFVCRR